MTLVEVYFRREAMETLRVTGGTCLLHHFGFDRIISKATIFQLIPHAATPYHCISLSNDLLTDRLTQTLACRNFRFPQALARPYPALHVSSCRRARQASSLNPLVLDLITQCCLRDDLRLCSPQADPAKCDIYLGYMTDLSLETHRQSTLLQASDRSKEATPQWRLTQRRLGIKALCPASSIKHYKPRPERS